MSHILLSQRRGWVQLLQTEAGKQTDQKYNERELGKQHRLEANTHEKRTLIQTSINGIKHDRQPSQKKQISSFTIWVSPLYGLKQTVKIEPEHLLKIENGWALNSVCVCVILTAERASAILAFFSLFLAASRSRRLFWSSFRSFCKKNTATEKGTTRWQQVYMHINVFNFLLSLRNS